VVEIDPELKLRLYTVLTSQGLTLKDWFVREAGFFVEAHEQPSLFVAQSPKSRKNPRGEV
jgi:hypothetical protein